MNNRIEACRQCTVQCKLEDMSQEIFDASKADNSMNSSQFKNRVSVMSQKAGRIGCPSTEIARVRKTTFQEFYPHLYRPSETIPPKSGLQLPDPVYDREYRLRIRRR